MNFNLNEKISNRGSLVVWVKNAADQKRLYQFGDVAYISKKLRYAYLYVPKDETEEIKAKLQKATFVRKVLDSQIQNLEFDSAYQKEMMQQLHDDAMKFNEMEQNK